jgi:NitT/TauT family transport system substrate-binding protein
MKKVTVFFALGATVCLGFGTSAQAADTLKILMPVWSGFAPVLVAKDLGYYKEQNLEVDARFEDDLPTAFAAIDSGNIDMHMRTIGEYQNRPANIAKGGKIIGMIDQSVGGDGVVADGSIKTAADMKGKTLAQTPSLPAVLLLQLDLKKVGLSLKDLDMKLSEPGDAVATFSDTSIAAVATSEPYLSQTIKQNPDRKAHLLSSSKDYPGYIVDVVIARDDDLATNPDKYRRFLVALYKSISLYKTDPEKFIAIAAPHYNLSPEEFKNSITGTLAYVPLDEAARFLGTPEEKGPMFGIFDTVMDANLESGVASQKMSAAGSIDSSVIAKVSEADLK